MVRTKTKVLRELEAHERQQVVLTTETTKAKSGSRKHLIADSSSRKARSHL
jgi:hypothetical protein